MATNADENCTSSAIPSSTASPPLYSEIPGTIPLNDTLEDTPPPSYNDVVNPEASPPTYQSLFGQVREARKNSSGFVDFFKKVIVLLLGTIGCTVVLAVTIVVPVSMIIVGSKYFGECPVEQFIPIYLIVGGTFGVLKNLMSFFSRLKKSPSEQERLIYRSRDSILNCFLITWFITEFIYAFIVMMQGAFRVLKNLMRCCNQLKKRLLNCFFVTWFLMGCIWTYKVYEPEYEDDSSPFYCNRTLYLFAFWLVTSSFIIVGLMSILIMCFVVSSIVTAVER